MHKAIPNINEGKLLWNQKNFLMFHKDFLHMFLLKDLLKLMFKKLHSLHLLNYVQLKSILIYIFSRFIKLIINNLYIS